MMKPIYNYAGLSDEALAQIEVLVSGHKTLDRIVTWSAVQGYKIAAMLAQDEFSHDIVVAYENGLYLAYDATWLGAVTAVAVWDHEPTPQELLAARLARGWKPVASDVHGGQKILGYAACLVK